MKRSTVKNRRTKSAKYFENGDSSKYGRKIELQKKGNFSARSPFSIGDGQGIELKQFNKLRFKAKSL